MISSDIVPPNMLDDETMADVRLCTTAIPTENACTSLRDELNSTEKIPSSNGDKMNMGL